MGIILIQVSIYPWEFVLENGILAIMICLGASLLLLCWLFIEIFFYYYGVELTLIVLIH